MADITNKNPTVEDAKDKAGSQRARRERGPPADGIASKTKVMVANLPYDLTEDKVTSPATRSSSLSLVKANMQITSLWSSSRTTSLLLPRSLCVPSLAS